MTATQLLLTILIIAAATLLTRALPFLVFPDDRAIPKTIRYFGQVLPPAILGMLVVYCLRGVTIERSFFTMPELYGVLATALLQMIFRKSLVSILLGTALFIALRFLLA